jgi:hypothetical protein
VRTDGRLQMFAFFDILFRDGGGGSEIRPI